MIRKFIGAVSLVVMTMPTLAKDLGVEGKVFENTDVDLRLIVMKEVSELNWDKMNENKEEDIKRQLQSMPYTVTYPPVEETEVSMVDMSIVLQQDINAPVRMPDGSFQWQTLGKAGDTLNPFEMVQPIEKFFFFDPASKVEMDFAVALKESGMVEDRYINLVAIGGDLMAANEKLGEVGYGYDYIVNGFRVTRSMSFVYLPTGSKLAKLVQLKENSTVDELNEILKDSKY